MTTEAFHYTLFIGASAEKIWEALTSTEYTFQYWGGRSIESDWNAGDKIEMRKPDGNLEWRGLIQSIEPAKELIYSWQLVDAQEKGLDVPTIVHITLDTHGRATRLTLTQSGFGAQSKTYATVAQGWPAILSSLKTLMETDEPLHYS